MRESEILAILPPSVARMAKLAAVEFAPDFAPRELRELGVMDRLVDRPPASGRPDWLSWYEQSDPSSVSPDDAAMEARWRRLRAGHGGAFARNPTPARGLTLLNWAIDPMQLLPEDRRAAFLAAMERHAAGQLGPDNAVARLRAMRKRSDAVDGLCRAGRTLGREAATRLKRRLVDALSSRAFPLSVGALRMAGKAADAGAVAALREAKRESDRGNFPAKHAILRDLLARHAQRFVVDSEGPGRMVGLTYDPEGARFRIHAPRTILPPGLNS